VKDICRPHLAVRAVRMDRKSQGPVIVASPVGGTSIEDVAHTNPEKIFKEPVDIMEGKVQTQSGLAMPSASLTRTYSRLDGRDCGSHCYEPWLRDRDSGAQGV
jgi:hypothetical protein